MKWILSILLLISIGAIGQEDSTKYIWYRFQYGQRMPRGWWDSTAQLPYRDTTYTPARPGAIVMRPQDKQFYKWDGALWSILSGSGSSYTGPFNAPATGDTLVNSDKELKRLNPGYGILHTITGTNITQRADTASSTGLSTRSMLRDSTRLLLQNISMTSAIEFVHSGAHTMVYQNDTLIDKQITFLTIESYPVGFVERSTSIWAEFEPSTGTITLTNGAFYDDDHVIILYRTTPIFLLDSNGNPVRDGNGNFIILN